jgi:hypothetical protein
MGVHPRTTRLRLAWLFFGVLAVLAIVLPTFIAVQFRQDVRFDEEQRAFYELHDLAMEMIVEQAPGVVGEGDTSYIGTFDSFFTYVAKRRPQIVSTRDAPNPFPGLLPEKQYNCLQAQAADGNVVLIQSKTIYYRVRKYQFRLTCGASIRSRE